MKKLLFFLLLTGSILTAKPQEKADATFWQKGGIYNFNFTQVSLTNWAAGGQNSIAGVTKLHVFANYLKGNTSWDNVIDLGYGLSKIEDVVQKNEDIIDLQSKLGIKASKAWFYSASLTFKSQFAPGYGDAEKTLKTSGLLSPAYVTLAVGMDYKPSKQFSLLLSPVTGKLTIVADKEIDATKYGLSTSDASTRMELGASLKALFNTQLVKNVGLLSELGLFSNYLDQPQNVDVDLKIGLNMKINDYLSAQIDTRILYDADVIGPEDDKAKIQFKELLGIGLNLKF